MTHNQHFYLIRYRTYLCKDLMCWYCPNDIKYVSELLVLGIIKFKQFSITSIYIIIYYIPCKSALYSSCSRNVYIMWKRCIGCTKSTGTQTPRSIYFEQIHKSILYLQQTKFLCVLPLWKRVVEARQLCFSYLPLFCDIIRYVHLLYQKNNDA